MAEQDPEALRHFAALPDKYLSILGPRRIPPVVCPMSSTVTALPVSTSVGFAMLDNTDYVDYVHKLRPDIIISLADMPYGETAGSRRMQKMSTRTEKWTKEVVRANSAASSDNLRSSLFVPILPVDSEAQSLYLELLGDELKDNIDGLALYLSESAIIIPHALAHLPRISMTGTSTPQDVLRDVQLGADICAIPFINAATDAGIALSFVFPARNRPDKRLPMGIDMWTADHATDLSSLTPGCRCYACEKHHRAYIQHLLSAKEMLAWVLLQIHNLQVMDDFFAAIRESIQQDMLDEDIKAFQESYEGELPTKTGQGPRYANSILVVCHSNADLYLRVRGYQRKSEGPNEPKQNALAYRTLNDAAERRKEEGLRPSPLDDAADLEKRGFGVEAEK